MAAFMGCIQQSNADSTAASPGKILNTPLLQTSDFGHDISSASGDNGNDGALTVDERTARRERWTRIKQAEEEDDDQAASSQSLKNGLTFGQDYSLVGDGLWTLLSNKFGSDVCLNFDVEEQSEGEKEHMNMFMAGTESGLIGGNTPANDVKDTPTRKVVKIGDDVVPLPENGTFDYDELRPRNANDDRSSGGLVSEDDSSRRVSTPRIFHVPYCIISIHGSHTKSYNSFYLSNRQLVMLIVLTMTMTMKYRHFSFYRRPQLYRQQTSPSVD